MFKWIYCLLIISSFSYAQVPAQPNDPHHPGSAAYSYTIKQENIQIARRRVDVFLPAEAKNQSRKAPVIIFGHGQAIDVAGYELTFKHLAQKGIAVIHPTYDTGFFDQDWRRMADDFNNLTEQAIQKYSDYIDDQKIIYSGHSKGAYISLMAAGAPSLKLKVSSIILFAPAGFDTDYLKSINVNIPITIAWSDADTVIKQSLITDIYTRLPSKFKQWILVKSYSALKADHFFPLSKSYFFGGQNGTTALHYFASWKWLIGAAWDLSDRADLSNPYLYGDQAALTGVNGLEHIFTRSW